MPTSKILALTLVALMGIGVGCGETQSSPAGDLFIASGNNQSGDTEELLGAPLKVRLIGTGGSVRAGVPVRFELIEGPGGLLTQDFVSTNANGIAETFLKLGVLPVLHRVRASVAGSEVFFEAEGLNLTPPEPIQFVDGLLLPQSIAFDDRGSFFVGTGLFGEITRYDSSFTSRKFSGVDNQSFRGLAFDRRGFLYAADAEGGRILEISPDGLQRGFIEQVDFRPLDQPNVIAIHPRNGQIYFTETGADRIWRVPPSGSPLTSFSDTIASPTGLAFSERGDELFIGSRSESAVFRYEVLEDGSAGIRDRYATVPAPEGMAFDQSENLFVAGTAFLAGGNAIWIVPRASGEATVMVPAPAGRLYTNLAFGRDGFDIRTIYMLSVDGTLDAVFLDSRGLPLPAASRPAP